LRDLIYLPPCRLLFVFAVSWCFAFDFARATESSDIPSPQQLQAFTVDPEKIYGTTAVYQVFRDGKEIGQHALTFSRADKELTITVDSNLAVKILGVTVYRYRYTAEEVWSGGELVSVSSNIKDNRKALQTIKALNRGSYWTIEKKGVERTTSSPEYSTNHWHPGALLASRVYHPLHGRVYGGNARPFGWERVVSEDGVVRSARKFRYSEGFKAVVWYDEQWRWLKLEFAADDGSRIVYSCLSCGE